METVTARELLAREFVGVSESDSVAAAVELMLEEDALDVVVLRGSEPVGTLTSTDALGLLAGGEDAREVEVGAAMSERVPTVEPDATLTEVAGRVADDGVHSLLVTDGDDLLGVISGRDVIRTTAAIAADAAVAGTARGTAEPAAVATEGGPSEVEDDAADPEYSTQSVCEICGTLTPDLRNFNGQLICADCREV